MREGNWDIDSYESIEEYFNDHSSRSTCVKLEDLEQRILERGAAQVAKELEVSRATLKSVSLFLNLRLLNNIRSIFSCFFKLSE